MRKLAIGVNAFRHEVLATRVALGGEVGSTKPSPLVALPITETVMHTSSESVVVVMVGCSCWPRLVLLLRFCWSMQDELDAADPLCAGVLGTAAAMAPSCVSWCFLAITAAAAAHSA